MRFIPTIAHGIADYIVGFIVIAMPFYFGWSEKVRFVFVALGAAVIGYSLLTDYELGLIRVLRLRLHLPLDGLFGAAMLVVPTLLHVPLRDSALVYVIGALSIFLSFTTKIRAQGTASEAAM
ncbi:hypothetical protein M2171_002472 [Bradyrhizobium japonicum USDA 38]|uniref:hypothetical protein n=1 Tax=Bradyrhizobium japonicum TaxID=375 RepID=UPI0004144BD9|nr:hypothetical protein [Bradyrhizobium japonicum]MCS3893339.1 hypothetical protein [Bradyrhizobium japonicum USDA 38]MCS3945853.1 hypothetical protein [Bradyrhizobium japonicum]